MVTECRISPDELTKCAQLTIVANQVVLCASIGAAAERGHPLHTGRNTGALMATLAVAALSRLTLTAAGGGGLGALVEWLPVVTWATAAALLFGLRTR